MWPSRNDELVNAAAILGVRCFSDGSVRFGLLAAMACVGVDSGNVSVTFHDEGACSFLSSR